MLLSPWEMNDEEGSKELGCSQNHQLSTFLAVVDLDAIRKPKCHHAPFPSDPHKKKMSTIIRSYLDIFTGLAPQEARNLPTYSPYYWIFSDNTTPYPTVIRRLTRFSNADAPCTLPKELLSLVISFECGGLS